MCIEEILHIFLSAIHYKSSQQHLLRDTLLSTLLQLSVDCHSRWNSPLATTVYVTSFELLVGGVAFAVAFPVVFSSLAGSYICYLLFSPFYYCLLSSKTLVSFFLFLQHLCYQTGMFLKQLLQSLAVAISHLLTIHLWMLDIIAGSVSGLHSVAYTYHKSITTS